MIQTSIQIMIQNFTRVPADNLTRVPTLMDSRNLMDCCERIRTSATNSLDKWITVFYPIKYNFKKLMIISLILEKVRFFEKNS